MALSESLKGKKYIVTGGSSGIGLALSVALCRAGAEVVAIARNFDDTDFEGQPIHYISANLLEPDSIGLVMGQAFALLGHVDGLINNAGRMAKAKCHDMPSDMLREVMALHVEVNHQTSAYMAKKWMADKTGGAIVNVSSYLAQRNFPGASGYGASKAALEALTRSMALEWGRYQIRVNGVAPGWVETAMTEALLSGPAGGLLRGQNPMRRLAQVDDIVPVIAFLLSAEAGYINGAIIPVDGGQHLS